MYRLTLTSSGFGAQAYLKRLNREKRLINDNISSDYSTNTFRNIGKFIAFPSFENWNASFWLHTLFK